MLGLGRLIHFLAVQNLYIQSQKEIDRYNESEKERSDEACEWITSSSIFKEWFLDSRSGVLTMFGDMGSGKTAIASYVAKYLSREPSGLKSAVLAFYCKGQETTNIRVIYNNHVYQLVQKKPELKPEFQRWYDKAQADTQLKPTDDAALVGSFLRESIKTSKGSVYIVFDDLDECS